MVGGWGRGGGGGRGEGINCVIDYCFVLSHVQTEHPVIMVAHSELLIEGKERRLLFVLDLMPSHTACTVQ